MNAWLHMMSVLTRWRQSKMTDDLGPNSFFFTKSCCVGMTSETFFREIPNLHKNATFAGLFLSPRASLRMKKTPRRSASITSSSFAMICSPVSPDLMRNWEKLSQNGLFRASLIPTLAAVQAKRLFLQEFTLLILQKQFWVNSTKH